MKVVINKCYGGFSLSQKAVMRYAKLKGITLYPWLDEITKKHYGDQATLDNPHVLIHYCTEPVIDGKYKKGTYFSDRTIERDDPILMMVIEELGSEANGRCAELKIVEIPDNVEWTIEEYDGQEWISEKHETWG